MRFIDKVGLASCGVLFIFAIVDSVRLHDNGGFFFSFVLAVLIMEHVNKMYESIKKDWRKGEGE